MLSVAPWRVRRTASVSPAAEVGTWQSGAVVRILVMDTYCSAEASASDIVEQIRRLVRSAGSSCRAEVQIFGCLASTMVDTGLIVGLDRASVYGPGGHVVERLKGDLIDLGIEFRSCYAGRRARERAELHAVCQGWPVIYV